MENAVQFVFRQPAAGGAQQAEHLGRQLPPVGVVIRFKPDQRPLKQFADVRTAKIGFQLRGKGFKAAHMPDLAKQRREVKRVAGLPRAPEVGFAGVEWLGVGEHAGEQHLSLRLALRNPNREELRLEAFVAELALDGVVLGHGRADGTTVLPPEGEAELAVQSVVRLDRAFALWTQARLSGRKLLPYRLSGRASFAGYGELPFERVGEVSLKDLGRWRKGMRSDDRPL